MKRLMFLVVLACLLFGSCAPPDYLGAGLFACTTAPVTWDDTAATAHLAAALVCMECSPQAQANRDKMADFVGLIKTEHPEVRLILFSETVLGWYLHPDDPAAYQQGQAEAKEGPTMQLVESLAVSHDLYVGYGYAERDGDAVYNSFALIDPSGALIANHRKVYLAPRLDDACGFTPGDAATTAYVDGIKVGLEICMDFSSAYLADAYGSDPSLRIILSPLADSNAGSPPVVFPAVRLRNKWVLLANRIGTEGDTVYSGWSGFYDPAGRLRSGSSGAEGYLYMNVGVVE